MGPSMIVDGDTSPTPLWPSRAEASMGPSMIVDGDEMVNATKTTGLSSFNGAVDDRRRRHYRQTWPTRQALASMGPSMIVDGDAVLYDDIAIGVVKLQWGRR